MAEPSKRSLLDSLAAFAASGVATVQTRLQLLSVELAEERRLFIAILAMMLLAAILLSLALVAAGALLVANFWSTHPYLVLGCLAAGLAVGGMTALAVAMRMMKSKSPPFAASLAALHKDRRALRVEP